MKAKKFLQNRHPYMKKHWNENEVIDDDWIVQEMEQYAKEQAVEFADECQNDISIAPNKPYLADLYDQFKQQ